MPRYINCKKVFLLLTLFIAFVTTSWSQGYVQFHAFTYAKQVVEDTRFDVRFTVKGGNITDFTPPSFENFEVLGNPAISRGVNTQDLVVNGQYKTITISSQTYIYQLKPKKIGHFKIGSATATVKGKKYHTKELSVQVLRNKAKPKTDKGPDGTQPLYLKLEIDSSIAVIGQHVRVRYKLYSSNKNVDFDLGNIVELPNLPIQEGNSQQGVLSSFFKNSTPAYLEVINGIQYYATVLKEYHVFPDKKGEFVFPTLQVVIKTPKQIIKRGLFQQIVYDKELIDCEPSALFVKDFPKGRDKSFSGIVGKNTTLKTIVSQTKMSTDEGFTLRMEVDSDMAEDRMLAPKLNLGEAFEVFDPSITTFQDKYEGQWNTKKIFDYTVLPKREGQYNITPQFQIFNTSTFDYEIIKDKTFQLNITKGSNPDSRAVEGKNNELLNRKLKPIKTDKGSTPSYFVSSPFYLALLGLPILLLLGGIYYKATLKKKPTIDKATHKMTNASKIANESLNDAKKAISDNQFKEAFKAIQDGLLNYTANKMKVPTEQFSKQNALKLLGSKSIDPSIIDDFKTVLEDCELALFAPITNDEKVTASYEKAKAIIKSIEESNIV